jgi:hypothetical protein
MIALFGVEWVEYAPGWGEGEKGEKCVQVGERVFAACGSI